MEALKPEESLKSSSKLVAKKPNLISRGVLFGLPNSYSLLFLAMLNELPMLSHQNLEFPDSLEDPSSGSYSYVIIGWN